MLSKIVQVFAGGDKAIVIFPGSSGEKSRKY